MCECKRQNTDDGKCQCDFDATSAQASIVVVLVVRFLASSGSHLSDLCAVASLGPTGSSIPDDVDVQQTVLLEPLGASQGTAT